MKEASAAHELAIYRSSRHSISSTTSRRGWLSACPGVTNGVVPVVTPAVFNAKIELPGIGRMFGTGWLPPMPDLRDYTAETPGIAEMAENQRIPSSIPSLKAQPLPTNVDLRLYCSPVEDQGSLSSCTASAAVGVVEYFERRAFGKHLDGSRLFVYKATRDLMGVVGDTGAWLRNTMGALRLYGVAPESYWPYTESAAAGGGERAHV